MRPTVTAADGSYLFTSVAPGPYDVVVITPPAGYTADPVTRMRAGPLHCLQPHRANLAVLAARRVGRIRLRVSEFPTPAAPSATGSTAPITNARHRQRHRLNLYGAGVDNQLGTFDDVLVASTATDAGLASTASAACRRASTAWSSPTLTWHWPGLTNTSSRAASVTITCPVCTTVTDQDFGDAPPSTTGSGIIGNTVYFDSDGSGSQAASGEPGIAGVTVELLNDARHHGAGDQVHRRQRQLQLHRPGGRQLPRARRHVDDRPGQRALRSCRRRRPSPARSPSPVSGSTCNTDNSADFGFAPTTSGTGNAGRHDLA